MGGHQSSHVILDTANDLLRRYVSGMDEDDPENRGGHNLNASIDGRKAPALVWRSRWRNAAQAKPPQERNAAMSVHSVAVGHPLEANPRVKPPEGGGGVHFGSGPRPPRRRGGGGHNRGPFFRAYLTSP